MAELFFLRKHRWAELSVACSWHNFLCHGGSTNARSSPRLGVFSRWHHKDMHLSPPVEPPDFEVRLSASVHCTAHPNPQPTPCFQPLDSDVRKEQLRYYTPDDLWEMWSDETRAARL